MNTLLKSATLLFLLFFTYSISFGQQFITKVQGKIESARNKSTVVISIAGIDNTSVLIELGKKNGVISILDPKLNLINSLQVDDCPYFDKFPVLLGGISLDENSYVVFFTNHSKKAFCSWKIDLKNGMSQYEIPTQIGSEKYIESFDNNHRFFIMTYEKGKSADEIKVWAFLNEKDPKISQFTFDHTPANKEKIEFLRDALINNDKIKIGKISPSVPNTIGNTHYRSKLYFSGDSILITYDRHECSIWTLNIKNGTWNYKTFGVEDEFKNFNSSDQNQNRKNSSVRYNSFIDQIHGRIYLGALYADSLIIRIKSLNSGASLQKFSINKNSPIGFNNTDILQKKNFGGGRLGIATNFQRTLEDPAQLLRKMNNGQLALAVNTYGEKDSLELTIGSYTELNSNGTDKGSFQAAISYIPISGGTAGYVLDASLENLLNQNYQNFKNSKVAYFKTLLNSNSLIHISGPVRSSVFEKIQSFEREVLVSQPIGMTLFPHKNYLVYGYYDRRNNEYPLLRFDY